MLDLIALVLILSFVAGIGLIAGKDFYEALAILEKKLWLKLKKALQNR